MLGVCPRAKQLCNSDFLMQKQEESANFSTSKRRLLDLFLRGNGCAPEQEMLLDSRLADNRKAPLGATQEKIVRRSLQENAHPGLYKEVVTIHRKGRLEKSVLEACLLEIVRRHEIWRTSFRMEAGELYQQVLPAPKSLEIPFVDLSGLPLEKRGEEIKRRIQEIVSIPFELGSDCLLRVLLLKDDVEEFRVIFVLHQSIVDGISAFHILPTEFATLYEAYSRDVQFRLPDLPVQYGDFCVWQRKKLQYGLAKQQRKHWQQKLTPFLELPERAVQESQSVEGHTFSFVIPVDLSRKVLIFVEQKGTTLFTVLAAVFAMVMAFDKKITNLRMITLAPSGRKRVETQNLLGYFLNPVTLFFDFNADPIFEALVCSTQVSLAEALENDDLPWEEAMQNEDKKVSILPSGQIAISLQPRSPQHLLPGWYVTSMDEDTGASVWGLCLELFEGKDGLLEGRAQYAKKEFGVDDVEKIVERFGKVLHASINCSTNRVSELMKTV